MTASHSSSASNVQQHCATALQNSCSKQEARTTAQLSSTFEQLLFTGHMFELV
jgi:hypothetical protein